ncbi:MAG: hypothetical protein IPL13_15030 [Saprospiraceae bacterium]|nr:hypothetical protein [Candidatus Brachybacter algidus]
MKFLFLFLIISLNLPAQEIVGKWEVIGYEDDLVYYNKTKDSINFKNPTSEEQRASFKSIAEILIFSVLYEFNDQGIFIMKTTMSGEIKSDYVIDKTKNTINFVDENGNDDSWKYKFVHDNLLINIISEEGFMELELRRK